MSRILCIETSTKACSVTLAEKGKVIDSAFIISEQYSHAEQLHPLISKLEDINIHPPHAVAVSKGPGSFTGLRIGVAAAKGLCFAWNVPLIAVDTLTLLFEKARLQDQTSDVYIPMIDARRMEVYMRMFEIESGSISEVEAKIIGKDFFEAFSGKKISIFGDGAEKFESLLMPNHKYIPGLYPDAAFMAPIAQQKLDRGHIEDLAYFEPYYLKDFLPGPVKAAIL